MRWSRRHREPNVSPRTGEFPRARTARRIAMGALVIGAAAAVALSFVPYDTLKSHVDTFSVDQDADVSRAEFADIVARLRILGSGLAALAIGLLAAGRPIDRTTAATFSGWWAAARQSPRRLREWLALEHPVHLAAFGVVVVAAIVIRAVFLDVPLRYDEAATYDNYVSKPVYVALANYSTPNNHLLHTFLAKVSVTLFGSAPWAIRLPALLAGIALVPATYAFARVFYGVGSTEPHRRRLDGAGQGAHVPALPTPARGESEGAGFAGSGAGGGVGSTEPHKSGGAGFAGSGAGGGKSAALLAAALVASSSTLVEYSTNARGYTIVALLTLVALLAGARVLETDSPASWALVAVAGALGLYTVPIMLYPIGGIFLWLLLSRWTDDRPLRPFLPRVAWCGAATVVLTLLLYAPVFAASGIRSVTSNEFVEPQSFASFLDLLPDHLRDTFHTWDRDLPSVVTALLAIGLVASLALTPLVSRFRVPPVLAIVVWTAPVLTLQRVVPFTRVWLFVVPLVLAAAAGFYGRLLERGPRRAVAGAAIAVAAAVAGSALVWSADSVRESRETGGLLDAPAIATYLAERVRPGDRILATGSDTILEYYLERKGVDAAPLLYTDETRPRTFVVVNVLGGQTLEDLLRDLDGARAASGRARLLRRYPSALVYLLE